MRDFYAGLLGCQLQSSAGQTQNIPDNIDLFVFPGEEVVGMQYTEKADEILTIAEHRRGCCMEIKIDDVEGLKQKLRDFGVQEITDFWDPEHFYFHAPGGQVYRLLQLES